MSEECHCGLIFVLWHTNIFTFFSWLLFAWLCVFVCGISCIIQSVTSSMFAFASSSTNCQSLGTYTTSAKYPCYLQINWRYCLIMWPFDSLFWQEAIYFKSTVKSKWPRNAFLNEGKEFMQDTQHTQQTATRTAQHQDKETTWLYMVTKTQNTHRNKQTTLLQLKCFFRIMFRYFVM